MTAFSIQGSVRAKAIEWLKARQLLVDNNVDVAEVDDLDDVWSLGNAACAVWWAEAKAEEGIDGEPVLGGSGEMARMSLFLALKSSSILTPSSALSSDEGVLGAESYVADILSKDDGIRKQNLGTDGEIGRCFLRFSKMAVVPSRERVAGGSGPLAVVVHLITSAFEQ